MDLAAVAREAVICLPTNTVAQVIGMLEDRSEETAVVVDLDMRPVGLVSAQHLASTAMVHPLGVKAQVGTVKRDVVAVGYLRSLEDARLQMQAWELKSLPVLDEESRLIGMVHLDDVVKADDSPPAPQPSRYAFFNRAYDGAPSL